MRLYTEMKVDTHLIITLLFPVGLLPLGALLALFDVHQHLRSLLLTRTRVHLVPGEPPQHTLEDMPDLCLEMILVIVRPPQERRDEFAEMWADDVDGEGVNGEFDEA